MSAPFTVVAEATSDGTDVRVDLSEPQFIDDVRTLAVDDVVRLPGHGDWCMHVLPHGWVCSRTRGHDPHDYPHAAGSPTGADLDAPGPGRILAVADPEPRPSDLERDLTERLAESDRQLRLAMIRAERAQEARQRAETMIEQIRDYALEKMRDGIICRDGTRDFLRHFDLPGFEHRFSVQVLVTVEMTSEDDGEDVAEDVRQRVSNAVNRYVDNVQDVTVNDWDDLGEADD